METMVTTYLVLSSKSEELSPFKYYTGQVNNGKKFPSKRGSRVAHWSTNL